LEGLNDRFFLSDIETVGSILRANGEVRGRKVGGRKICAAQEKRGHGNDDERAQSHGGHHGQA
jgi:hypothetical protein